MGVANREYSLICIPDCGVCFPASDLFLLFTHGSTRQVEPKTRVWAKTMNERGQVVMKKSNVFS